MGVKAAQINKFGDPDVIEIFDIPKPKVSNGKVLIKVYASSINPVDIKIIEGAFSNVKFPFTLGSDVAGVITEIGEEVENFNVGNKVYGSAIALAGATGAFAEFALVPAGMVARMPRNLNFNQAASVVLTGTSSVQAFLEHFKLKADQKILIHGGAGGIGTIAIQIAKHMGLYVATTATGEGIDYVKKLGADEIIDYRNQDFEKVLSDCDAVFDTVGGQTYEKCFKVLRENGIIVSMLMPVDQKLTEQYKVTAVSQFTKVNREHLDMLTKFIEDKVVKPHIDKVYLLENMKEAFKEKLMGDVKGKIVIEIF